VLQALTVPASTSELAHRLMVTSGAVSQHLDRLKHAGLVEAHRSGRRVYYQLTRRGEELILLFERIL
jgi:DNA-binding MarR family transcriptional regulator